MFELTHKILNIKIQQFMDCLALGILSHDINSNISWISSNQIVLISIISSFDDTVEPV